MSRHIAVLNALEVGGELIFRPNADIAASLTREYQRYLTARFKPGKYKATAQINDALQSLFGFAEQRLRDALRSLASVAFLQYCLHQYDLTDRIEDRNRQGKLSREDAALWRSLGPKTRRALKCLCEYSVRLGPLPDDFPSGASLDERFAIAWHAAEAAVALSELSDQTFLLFPDKTTLRINRVGRDDVIELRVDGFTDEFAIRVSRSADVERKYLPSAPFEFQVDEHAKVLNPAFSKDVGMRWGDAAAALVSLIERMPCETNSFDVPVVERESVAFQMSHHFNVSCATAERVLDGFTISKAKMDAEGRVIWRPNQEYRLFRRGIIEVDTASGLRLMWSRPMARLDSLQRRRGVQGA